VSSSALDNNFEFYVARGTFGTINSGQDITIPAGTQIYTAQGLSGKVVLTANPVTCKASQASAPFAVTNLQAASAGNAAAGVFTNSNFTNYADSAYGSLLVTNNYGLIGAAMQNPTTIIATASTSGSNPKAVPPKRTFVSRFLYSLESRILILYDRLAPSSATSTASRR